MGALYLSVASYSVIYIRFVVKHLAAVPRTSVVSDPALTNMISHRIFGTEFNSPFLNIIASY